MKKIKTIIKGLRARLYSAWQWLFNWHGLKRYQIAGKAIFLILFSLLAYSCFSLIFVSPGQLSWLRLRESWESEDICHEDCWVRRRAWQADIVSGLRSGDRQLIASLQDYLESGSGPSALRQDLIRVLALAFGPDQPPDYLFEMIDKEDSGFQATYYASFHPTGRSASPYYVSLAADDSKPLAVRLAALSSLASLAAAEKAIDANQLAMLGGLALSPDSEAKLRQRLVLLLPDYYQAFPELIPEILEQVYFSESLADDISRAFAADWLNRLSATSTYSLPQISEAQWQDYYNN